MAEGCFWKLYWIWQHLLRNCCVLKFLKSIPFTHIDTVALNILSLIFVITLQNLVMIKFCCSDFLVNSNLGSKCQIMVSDVKFRGVVLMILDESSFHARPAIGAWLIVFANTVAIIWPFSRWHNHAMRIHPLFAQADSKTSHGFLCLVTSYGHSMIPWFIAFEGEGSRFPNLYHMGFHIHR